MDIGAYGADLNIRELVDIHRQADPAFKAMLNAVRYGRVTSDIAEILNDTGARTPPDPADGEHPIITLATRNDIVNSINRRHLIELIGREQTATAEISGDFGRGEASYPADVDLKLKVGAQVMFLRNDTGSYGEPPRWVNGTIGTVTRIAGGTVRVEVEGQEFDVEPAVWERFRYAYDPGSKSLTREIVAEFTQFPAAARVGRDDPQEPGQDVRPGDRRPRLGRVRPRSDVRRAVAADLARRALPVAAAAPERHPRRPGRPAIHGGGSGARRVRRPELASLRRGQVFEHLGVQPVGAQHLVDHALLLVGVPGGGIQLPAVDAP